MNRDLMYSYYYNSNTDNLKTRQLYSPEKSNNNEQTIKLECTCNRSPSNITCRHCGMSFIGRKRVCCVLHQDTIHLMDFLFCPGCKNVL